jgi:hypothetical protein
MRPYLAIIKDSFREALASKVLWVLLSLITLLHLLTLPLGIALNLTTDVGWGDLVEGPQLVTKLRSGELSLTASPGQRIWSLIDEGAHEKLIKLARVDRGERGENRDFMQGMETLRAELNRLIHRRDLYDEAAWKGITLPGEARDLVARPRHELSEQELARMNRLLIESAFPAHFRNRSPHAVSLTYLGFDFTGPLPFSKERVETFLKEWVLSTTMSTVVGIIGIIAAILVTSTIIPQMFDPGSITLLLSKPVSRSLLFIAKFLGGCAFILLNVAYLIGGLWLIAGTRFGIWNHGMLWCIPIFLFMFLIYYSVSALTGLIWKSPVISVVMTVIFWFSCFTVGSVRGVMQGLVLDPQRIVKVAEAEGSLVSVTEAGVVQVWDDDRRQWRQIDEPDQRGGIPTVDGPVYHAQTGQLLIGQGTRNPFGMGGKRMTLQVGRGAEGWTLREGPPLPGGTETFLVENDGRILAVASDNIFRLRGSLGASGKPIKVFGMRLPFGGGAEFQPVLADSTLDFPDPLAAAADPREPKVVVVAGNDVYLFTRRDDGKYVQSARRTLEGDADEGAAVAIAGQYVLVAREEGQTVLLSASDLSIHKELALERYTQPRFALAAEDGSRFGVLFQNDELWLIDGETGLVRKAPVSGQGDISGFAFTADKLLVADRVHRVIAYDAATLAPITTFAPRMTRFEFIYFYGIRTLYTLFPKPGELDNTVHYALSGKRTTDMGLFRGDVAQRREDLHPWRPVISGLAFVGVMLLISCIYIERHEF